MHPKLPSATIPCGKPCLIGDPLQPFRLAHRIRRIPTAFDVHAFDHILVAGIRQIVFEQVVLGNWSEVTFQPHGQVFLQPRVFVAAEIPKVIVRVDHRMRNRYRQTLAAHWRLRVA